MKCLGWGRVPTLLKSFVNICCESGQKVWEKRVIPRSTCPLELVSQLSGRKLLPITYMPKSFVNENGEGKNKLLLAGDELLINVEVLVWFVWINDVHASFV